MKRNVKLIADDGDFRTEIQIKFDDRRRNLTRNETNREVQKLLEAAHDALVRNGNYKLTDVRIR